jgi:hypothetical protein
MLLFFYPVNKNLLVIYNLILTSPFPMQKIFNAIDAQQAKLRNQFTQAHTANAVNLIEDNKVYCVTEVRASGAWTVSVDGVTRNGSGNTQFFNPIAGDTLRFAGVTEVSGYFINV